MSEKDKATKACFDRLVMERNRANAEIEQLTRELDEARARTQCRRELPWCDCTALERERDLLRGLLYEAVAAVNAEVPALRERVRAALGVEVE